MRAAPIVFALLACGKPAPAPAPADPWSIVRLLSSDAFEGRAPGTEGGKKAREAIISELKRCGLAPAFPDGYEQKTSGPGVNVVAHLAGTDADRYVVLSAHYDHLGVNQGVVFNGADDNAAAVGSVLATACALAADGSKRKVTLIVALWDAEEPPHFLKPTMGSRYWVEHPHVRLANIEVAIALDLVGAGLWPGSPVHVALGAESSPELARAITDTPVPAGLVVGQASLHLVEQLVGGETRQPWSDYHYFREQSVPALFLSNGQSPRYHTPDDDFETLDLGKLSRQTTWLTALVAVLLDLPKDKAPRRAPFERLEVDRAAVKALLEAAIASGHFSGVAGDLDAQLVKVPQLDAHGLRAAVQMVQCLAPKNTPARYCLLLAEAPAPTLHESPFAPDPKVAETERRLRKVIDALNLWLKKHMSFPELTEYLVRDDYLRPTDFDDAWGRRIDYTRLDDMHYRLCSRGPDNLPKTEDDVCLGGRP